MRRFALLAAIVSIYAAATAFAFERSTLSGLAIDTDIAKSTMEQIPHGSALTPECRAILTDWTTAKLKEEIASSLPTAILFSTKADEALDHYASKACPFGPFLFASSTAQSMGRSARQRAALGR